MVDAIHDQLYLFSQANFTDKTKRKGPIKQREKPYTRPHQLYDETTEE